MIFFGLALLTAAAGITVARILAIDLIRKCRRETKRRQNAARVRIEFSNQ
jgi:hypothetical protein